MSKINIMDVLGGFAGSTIASVDTCTPVRLGKTLTEKNTPNAVLRRAFRIMQLCSGDVSKAIKNPLFDRVSKENIGANVMLFTNHNSNGYQNMVKRRLEAEGKDPESFTLSPRTWGERIPGTPIVRHTKDGVEEFYIEMIYNRPGKSKYIVDGKEEIDREDIPGLAPPKIAEQAQGGLDYMVQVRTVKLSNITAIRYTGKEFVGEFFYE